MTEEQIVLARRAVACRGWRWMPGMLAVEWAAPGMNLTGGCPVRVDERWHEVGVWLSDLTDPATLGCLLALVREAWVCDGVHARRLDGCREWTVKFDGPRLRNKAIGNGLSEAEALVAALEAAP